MPPSLAIIDPIDRAERELLTAEQVDIPVEHTFSPGLYVRTVRMPAGALVLGHRHREETLNFMMSGKLMVVVDGVCKVLTAPCILPSAAGTRKAAIIIEEVIWTNVHPNPDNETDIDKLENRYIEKSDAFLEFETKEMAALKAAHSTPETILWHGSQ